MTLSWSIGVAALFAIVAAVAGCHDDACVWTAQRDSASTTAIVERDGTAIAVTEIVGGAFATFDARTGQQTTHLSVRAALIGDPDVDTVVFDAQLVDPTTSTVILDRSSEFRLIGRGTIVATGAATGTVTLAAFEPRCEQSDVYLDEGGDWECALSLDATIEASLETDLGTFGISAQRVQHETLSETCHSCDGIEGCSY